MNIWHRSLIGLVLISLFIVGCSPSTAPDATEAPTQAATRNPADADVLTPAEESVGIIEEIDSVVVTKEPTPLVTPNREIVEEVMTPTSESSDRNTSSGGTNVFVETAVSDLAQRLNVEESEIETISFNAVVWPDGSLGCPQPGMMYTQVLKEGYKIVLEHDGKMFNYHGGEGRDPFLCEKQRTNDTNDTFVPPPNMDE